MRLMVLSEEREEVNIIMLGGRESIIMDIGLKIVMSSVACMPRSNFLIIDEGLSVLDKENISRVKELFSYLNSNYEKVLIISHIEGIKDYVDIMIKIEREKGGSKIISL